MKAQHTPGPWMATVGNRGTLCVISGDAWICGELSNGNGEVPGEAEANARLIASAPELLSALKDLVEAVYEHGTFVPDAPIDQANRIIARAERRS